MPRVVTAVRRDFRHAHWRSKFSPFFFQAEDGMRCLYVTGVQTCALPISLFLFSSFSACLPLFPMCGLRFQDQFLRPSFWPGPECLFFSSAVLISKLGILTW